MREDQRRAYDRLASIPARSPIAHLCKQLDAAVVWNSAPPAMCSTDLVLGHGVLPTTLLTPAGLQHLDPGVDTIRLFIRAFEHVLGVVSGKQRVFHVLPSPPMSSYVLPCPPMSSHVLPCPPRPSHVLQCPPMFDLPMCSGVLPCPPTSSPCPPHVLQCLTFPCPPVSSNLSLVLPCPPMPSHVLQCPPMPIFLCPPMPSYVIRCPLMF